MFDDGHLSAWRIEDIAALVSEIGGLTLHRLVRATTARDPRDLEDVVGEVWRRWRPRTGTAALIRPDHYVAWIQSHPSPMSLRLGVARALGLER